MSETCETCDYFFGMACLRRPPVAVPASSGAPHGFDWPHVTQLDWCGGWKERKPSSACGGFSGTCPTCGQMCGGG